MHSCQSWVCLCKCLADPIDTYANICPCSSVVPYERYHNSFLFQMRIQYWDGLLRRQACLATSSVGRESADRFILSRCVSYKYPREIILIIKKTKKKSIEYCNSSQLLSISTKNISIIYENTYIILCKVYFMLCGKLFWWYRISTVPQMQEEYFSFLKRRFIDSWRIYNDITSCHHRQGRW